MKFNAKPVITQAVSLPFKSSVKLALKREDMLHEFVSGNKYRKLKYNLIKAKAQGAKTLLTFGGAYSNHIAAVAMAGHIYGFKTVGVIRGEELHDKVEKNTTLRFAKTNGMQFKFVSRTDYRNKTSDAFLSALEKTYDAFYLIPEGGTNALAVKGCEEILTDADSNYDFVCCAVGTGGTISGLINGALPKQQILGFPALKGSFLHEDISKFAKQSNWQLIEDYHFGGYAKLNAELIHFINTFKSQHGISLDPVYTGKMMFGIYDLIQKGYFPNGAKILAVHTGGLQGIAGMNSVLKNKNLPLIQV